MPPFLHWSPAGTLETWKRSGRSAGERGKQEAAAKIQTKLLSKNAHQKQEAIILQHDTLRLLSRHEQTMIFRPLQTAQPHETDWNWKVSPLPLQTGSTNHSTCAAVMPSPQIRKHLANRKFTRKQTPWNSHRPTPDGAVHRPEGTTNIKSLHRTLKKKKFKY